MSSSNLISPLDFGAPSNGTSPASTGIQAAVDAIASGTVSGILWLDRPYALDAPIIHKKGVAVMGNGSFDRRSFPNTFNGVRLYPHEEFSGEALWVIGDLEDEENNPQGTYLSGLGFDGRDVNLDQVPDLVGLKINDTSDVRVFNSLFAGFDRSGASGFCVIVQGTGEGNCFGTTFSNCIFSSSQNGILYTGAGTTDMRHENNLFVGCTRSLTLGWDDRGGTPVQAGGAGCQIVNDHFTYTGMPAQGWFIRTGSQGGTLMCDNVYFDQAGTASPIRLGNSRARISDCHFLCAQAQNTEGLIRVMTAGEQSLIVANCSVNALNSNVRSLVWISAKAGLPTNLVCTGNQVQQNSPNWIGFAVDQNLAVIPDSRAGSYVKHSNVRNGVVEYPVPDTQGADVVVDAETTVTLDFGAYSMIRVEAQDDFALAFAAPANPQIGHMLIEAVDWGAHAVTWPAGMRFAGSIAPSLSSSGTDILIVYRALDGILTLSPGPMNVGPLP